MLKKKFSVKIRLMITLVTISLICSQILILNNSNKMAKVGAVPGTVVAFEESHNPMTSINATNPSVEGSGRYDSFAEQLINNSYTVETIDVGEYLNPGTLQNYDIIVIVASQSTYTAEEITEINTWVNNGGSLLIITDWGHFCEATRSLLNNFGYNLPYDQGLRDSDDLVGNTLQFYIDRDNMVTHDITSGVNRIEVYAATGFNETASAASTIIDTDSNDTTTWDVGGGLANNIPVLSALTGGAAGNGKIVTITDYNMWDSSEDVDGDGDDSFFDSDNAKLALNIINWLASTTAPISIDFFSIITMLTLVSIVFIKRKRK